MNTEDLIKSLTFLADQSRPSMSSYIERELRSLITRLQGHDRQPPNTAANPWSPLNK